MLNLKLIIIILIFLMGLVYFSRNTVGEPFGNMGYRCPNILIKKGNNVFLYNSNEAKVPGVNPIQFDNLNDYTEFVEWQRSQNIKCPILYLEETFDAQNNSVYSVKDNPFQQPDVSIQNNSFNDNKKNIAPLTDANLSNSLYNIGDYPAFDPLNQSIGEKPPLDNMYRDKSGKSANAMSKDWGGNAFTQAAVDSGQFADDYVSKQSS